MLERLLVAVALVTLGLGVYAEGQRRHLRRASRQTIRAKKGSAFVLYFRSDNCAPCITQWHFLEQLKAQFGDKLDIEKIAADLEPEKARRFGVSSLPTTLLVDSNGTVRHANYGWLTPGSS